eukprot:gene53035-biopygen43636
MVIIGGSGTGKSVLLKCILGLVRHDGGSITLDGQDVTKGDRDAFLARFGMLFQGGALFDSLRVWENVAFRLMRGTTKHAKAEARETAIEKLRRVGLKPEVADLFPAELSGGMQKRVGLARAIAASPEIIFFDEPTTGLDPIMAGVINDLIREIVTEMGATAMTITHDMSSVRAISDRVAMLHDGVGKLDHRFALRPNDAVLAITFAPYSEETLTLAQDAKARGLPVVALTDRMTSPLVRFSDAILTVPEVDFGAFRSLSATIAMAIALAVAVGSARGS